MGLDCSHNAWHGAYSAFMQWRRKIAEVAGLPPLDLMEGFYDKLDSFDVCCGFPTLHCGHPADTRQQIKNIDERLPIKWECLKPSPLHELLYHSDCDGEISSENCAAIADALEDLIPLFPDEDHPGHIGNWKNKTQKFVDGLRLAAQSGEALRFQ